MFTACFTATNYQQNHLLLLRPGLVSIWKIIRDSAFFRDNMVFLLCKEIFNILPVLPVDMLCVVCSLTSKSHCEEEETNPHYLLSDASTSYLYSI